MAAQISGIAVSYTAQVGPVQVLMAVPSFGEREGNFFLVQGFFFKQT